MFDYRPKRLRSEIVDTLPKLKKLYSRMMKLEEFAFDTETNTLRVLGLNKDFRLVGISISWGAYHNYYIPLGHIRDEDLDRQLDLDVVVKYLKPVFEREDARIIGHNLKFDMHTLSRVGIHIQTADLFDTMIASWLCNENTPNGLKENSSEKLRIDQTHFKDVADSVPVEVKKSFGLKANSKATFDMVLIDDGAPYALDDAFYTFELYKGFLDELEEQDMYKIYNKLYVPYIRTIYDMEHKGVTVDVDRLHEMSEEINEDMEDLQYRIIELAGVDFSLSSNAQLAELLFGYSSEPKEQNLSKQPKIVQKMFEEEDHEALAQRGLFIQDDCLFKMTGNPAIKKRSFNFRVLSKTQSGAPQTNADVLWKLSNMSFKDKRKREGVELCKLMLEYKKLEKLSSAFIDGLIAQLYEDGKAHPSFNIIGTDSGRLSCSNPNLQQLPKAGEEDKYQIRSLFIGSEDEVTGKNKKIVALDFANLEMRVLAHFSEDKNLIEMFLNGSDTHGSTAVNMFNLDCTPEEVKKKYPHLRQAAKVLNFLLMYGGGAPTLYEQLKGDHSHPVDLGDKTYLDTYKVKSGIDVAQIYIDRYFESYSGVTKFIRNQKRYAHRYGYVYTLLKRKRRLPDINSQDFKTQAYCERLSVNSAVQGSAADITMSAQNRVSADSWFDEHRINMLLQVHDELVFECPEEYVDECIEKVQHYMSHPFGDNVELNLPLRADADFGDSYQDAK